MTISLPNGKAVELPFEVMLLNDRDYDLYMQALMAMNAGDEVEDAFHDSVLRNVNKQVKDVKKEEEIEEIEDDGYPDDDLLLTRDDI